MAGEIIRQGDPTSHGGKVLEGSPSDICHGKPIAFIGHKVSCPACKGIFPIVEGVPTTTFYGKGVALAGMKTACGATLMATQFLDIVEVGGGGGGGVGSKQRHATSAPIQKHKQDVASTKTLADPLVNEGSTTLEIVEEHIYTLVDETGALVEDYRYDLRCDNVLHIRAGRYVDASTASVAGVKDSQMVCWLSKDGASKS